MRWQLMRSLGVVAMMALVTFDGNVVEAAPGFPATPQPTECVVAPRPLEEFKSLLVEPLTPTAGTPDSSPSLQGESLPGGEPGDQQTVEAVTSLVREYIACMNAGNPASAYALLTDEYLRQQLSESQHSVDALGGIDEFLDAMGIGVTPVATPPPDWRGALVSIDDVRLLMDGRIGALVTVEISPALPSSGARTNAWVFRLVADRLLIDDIGETIHEEGDASTPESSG